MPDPPFEFADNGKDCGFDIALMQAVAAELGLTWQLVQYTGADFNDIFDGLADGRMDCIASGTTVPDFAYAQCGLRRWSAARARRGHRR